MYRCLRSMKSVYIPDDFLAVALVFDSEAEKAGFKTGAGKIRGLMKTWLTRRKVNIPAALRELFEDGKLGNYKEADIERMIADYNRGPKARGGNNGRDKNAKRTSS